LNKVLKIISFISLCCPLILVTGCVNAQTEANTAIENLQKSVPYPIIVPTYFPRGISLVPSTITEPATDNNLNAVYFEIQYGHNADKIIILDEENYYFTLTPTNPYNTFAKNGVDVTYEVTYNGGSEGTNQGFLYVWNSDGVNFRLSIYGYGQDEGQKVLESMIK
jgi:hypothetical protein